MIGKGTILDVINEGNDNVGDLILRPDSLESFVGQKDVRERIGIFTAAAAKRREPLGHCLFAGPPGLGKTSLANILAKEMDANIVTTSGPVIDKASDLAGILTNLNRGDILFIDEIHRLNKTVEEYLYSAMERFSLDLLIDSGPNARSVAINIAPFSLVGATTRVGLLSSPMRSRFQMTFRLEYYSVDELIKIILHSSKTLGMRIDENSCKEIASRARGTPRIANNLLKWVRDFFEVKNLNISVEATKKALAMLALDSLGLDSIDHKILSTIVFNYSGGPVGIKAIAAMVGEEINTIEEVYEPYLVLRGLVKRTPKGREATQLAIDHLNRTNENLK